MSKIIGVTGHRPGSIGFSYDMTSPEWRWLKENYIEVLCGLPASHVITGMALGVDTLVAELCVLYKIPFTAAIPFEGQEVRWPPAAQEHYRELLRFADDIYVVSPGPYEPWKLFARNKWIVDHCDMLISAWNGKGGGGTASTVEMALKASKPVLNFNPIDKRITFRRINGS